MAAQFSRSGLLDVAEDMAFENAERDTNKAEVRKSLTSGFCFRFVDNRACQRSAPKAARLGLAVGCVFGFGR